MEQKYYTMIDRYINDCRHILHDDIVTEIADTVWEQRPYQYRYHHNDTKSSIEIIERGLYDHLLLCTDHTISSTIRRNSYTILQTTLKMIHDAVQKKQHQESMMQVQLQTAPTNSLNNENTKFDTLQPIKDLRVQNSTEAIQPSSSLTSSNTDTITTIRKQTEPLCTMITNDESSTTITSNVITPTIIKPTATATTTNILNHLTTIGVNTPIRTTHDNTNCKECEEQKGQQSFKSLPPKKRFLKEFQLSLPTSLSTGDERNDHFVDQCKPTISKTVSPNYNILVDDDDVQNNNNKDISDNHDNIMHWNEMNFGRTLYNNETIKCTNEKSDQYQQHSNDRSSGLNDNTINAQTISTPIEIDTKSPSFIKNQHQTWMQPSQTIYDDDHNCHKPQPAMAYALYTRVVHDNPNHNDTGNHDITCTTTTSVTNNIGKSLHYTNAIGDSFNIDDTNRSITIHQSKQIVKKKKRNKKRRIRIKPAPSISSTTAPTTTTNVTDIPTVPWAKYKDSNNQHSKTTKTRTTSENSHRFIHQRRDNDIIDMKDAVEHSSFFVEYIPNEYNDEDEDNNYGTAYANSDDLNRKMDDTQINPLTNDNTNNVEFAFCAFLAVIDSDTAENEIITNDENDDDSCGSNLNNDDQISDGLIYSDIPFFTKYVQNYDIINGLNNELCMTNPEPELLKEMEENASAPPKSGLSLHELSQIYLKYEDDTSIYHDSNTMTLPVHCDDDHPNRTIRKRQCQSNHQIWMHPSHHVQSDSSMATTHDRWNHTAFLATYHKKPVSPWKRLISQICRCLYSLIFGK